MNWEAEKKRIQKILDEMPMSEFEQMLERRGVGMIKNSCESSYVQCLEITQSNFYSNTENSKMRFNREDINQFSLEEQGAA